jgi:hypothetical protein
LPRGAFGPWLRELGDPEHCAQLRSLAELAAVFTGSGSTLVGAPRRAEQDDGALSCAYALFEGLPSVRKRRLLATYLAVEDSGASRNRRRRA